MLTKYLISRTLFRQLGTNYVALNGLIVQEQLRQLKWNPKFQFAKVNACSGYPLQE